MTSTNLTKLLKKMEKLQLKHKQCIEKYSTQLLSKNRFAKDQEDDRKNDQRVYGYDHHQTLQLFQNIQKQTYKQKSKLSSPPNHYLQNSDHHNFITEVQEKDRAKTVYLYQPNLIKNSSPKCTTRATTANTFKANYFLMSKEDVFNSTAEYLEKKSRFFTRQFVKSAKATIHKKNTFNKTSHEEQDFATKLVRTKQISNTFTDDFLQNLQIAKTMIKQTSLRRNNQNKSKYMGKHGCGMYISDQSKKVILKKQNIMRHRSSVVSIGCASNKENKNNSKADILQAQNKDLPIKETYNALPFQQINFAFHYNNLHQTSSLLQVSIKKSFIQSEKLQKKLILSDDIIRRIPSNFTILLVNITTLQNIKVDLLKIQSKSIQNKYNFVEVSSNKKIELQDFLRNILENCSQSLHLIIFSQEEELKKELIYETIITKELTYLHKNIKNKKSLQILRYYLLRFFCFSKAEQEITALEESLNIIFRNNVDIPDDFCEYLQYFESKCVILTEISYLSSQNKKNFEVTKIGVKVKEVIKCDLESLQEYKKGLGYGHKAVIMKDCKVGMTTKNMKMNESMNSYFEKTGKKNILFGNNYFYI